MTRQKKTRSLKRIHKVKTGSTSKLKKQLGHDRQGTKKVRKRVPSTYEKYLAEHPEAARQAALDSQKPAAKTGGQNEIAASITKAPDSSQPESSKKKKTLLDMLDDKDFDGFY